MQGDEKGGPFATVEERAKKLGDGALAESRL